jgi:hypothetical protein
VTGIVLRDGLEIQRAHDILKALVMEEVPFDMQGCSPVQLAGIHAALDTLCWVLGHRHNTAFEGNLEKIERALEAKGFKLRFGGKEPS